MVEKRRQAMELQTELSVRAHERLQAEGQTERLSLELQHVKEQLHAASQEKMSDPNPNPPARDDEGLSQVKLLRCCLS